MCISTSENVENIISSRKLNFLYIIGTKMILGRKMTISRTIRTWTARETRKVLSGRQSKARQSESSLAVTFFIISINYMIIGIIVTIIIIAINIFIISILLIAIATIVSIVIIVSTNTNIATIHIFMAICFTVLKISWSWDKNVTFLNCEAKTQTEVLCGPFKRAKLTL